MRQESLPEPASSGESGHQRRRSDWATSPTMIETVRYLISRPHIDQLAQFIVLHLLKPYSPTSAVLSTFDPEGTLHAVSSFGAQPGGNDAYRALSLWDPMPMSVAVRQEEFIVVMGSELSEAYPGLARISPLPEAIAAAPLHLPGDPVGAVQVAFAQAPDVDQLEVDLSGVTSVLALYLDLVLRSPAGQAQGTSHSRADSRSETRKERPSPSGGLSERQKGILRLMSTGLTNAQIAARIGFSESTVRQETMAIYRFLNVDGRREAAAAASARGLV